jgi:hypothetical protein
MPAFPSVMEGGLTLNGADVFETAMAFRLVNPSVPREESV